MARNEDIQVKVEVASICQEEMHRRPSEDV